MNALLNGDFFLLLSFIDFSSLLFWQKVFV